MAGESFRLEAKPAKQLLTDRLLLTNSSIFGQPLKIERCFFNRHVTEVARELIGQLIVTRQGWGIISETEAYRGYDDPASHAFRGPTPRAKVMFGSPGYSYVYLIYGLHYCFNLVAEEAPQAAAVLIRAISIPQGHSWLTISGPGRVCRYLGIDLSHNARDLLYPSELDILLFHTNLARIIEETPRIGISRGQEKLWRFLARAAQSWPSLG